ncbi:hypothetical protein CSE16_14300 [Solibacillus sp. R5-41]|uniref:hypothetical protein n=1 Tax=Solibacillus sp. R5-41 TaxID=2048654 RepID=UPI000C124E05|nr:hypothetical protein [Solibacillus sp. R5-41]ATP41127.1 hypothetical protein CSE16_14300 [Solibacillus sp. R5-41]
MNDYKRALNEVTGDMKESEQRLKNKLLYHKSPKRKKPFFLIPVGILCLFMMLMASWYMTEFSVDTKQARSSIEKNELLYEFYVASEQISWRNSDFNKENGFYNYLQALGVLELAKKYDLTYSAEEYKEQFEVYSQYPDQENLKQQTLEKGNISQKQFNEQLLLTIIELQIYRTKLNDEWYKKFPVMNDIIASEYTNQQATRYMEQHFAKEIEQFQQKHQIKVMNDSSQMPTTGVVASVNGSMFYFIENMTAQELTTLTDEQIFNQPEEKYASWILNGDEVPVQVGDYIKLKNLGTSVVDELNEQAISLSEDIEVLLPNERASEIQEVTFADDARQQMEHLLENAAWEANMFININYDKPLYIVHVNDTSYTIWENTRKQLIIMPFGQPEVWIMYQRSSKQLKALIEENVTK